MIRIALAAGLAMLAPFGASAQTTDQLNKGATDTSNVLNYGMGYNLQRFSPLTQINKDNAKNLVPVWNYSLADDRSEESQPIVYKGVLYVTTHAATMAVDAPVNRYGRPRSSIRLKRPGPCAAASSIGAPRSTTANCSAPRSTPT
jgi:alcohol dehydrogenase (cytochrome c)